MKRAVLATCLVLAFAHSSWASAERGQLRLAIDTVLADTLPDTSQVTDRLGFVHRVYADTGGLWYQTNEIGLEGSPAIRIAESGARDPVSFVAKDQAYGWVLAVVWLQETGQTPAVCCRRRALAQPFWVWTECCDVTPQRRGRP